MQGTKFDFPKEQLEQLTNLYSDTEISKILGITVSTVYLLRKRHAVLSYREKTGCRKRFDGKVLNPGEGCFSSTLKDLNRSYFDVIDTEFKAYFLGLFATDGHIKDKDQNCFASIELQKPDDVVLETLAKELNFCRGVKPIIRQGKKPSGRIRIYSRDLVYALMDKGMTFNTETHAPYLDLQPNLYRHFIRGVVDGDGHLSGTKKDLRIGGCSFDLISTVALWTKTTLGVEPKIIYRTLTSGKVFHLLTFRGSKEVVKWLYSDCNIAIPRKKEQSLIWLSR